MKKGGAFACLLGAMVVFSAAPAPAAEPKGPRIEIAEERYDLGTVVEGTEAVHVFAFRNVGDEELAIQKVQTS